MPFFIYAFIPIRGACCNCLLSCSANFFKFQNADWLLKNAVNGSRSTEEYRTAKLEKRAQEYRAAEITFAQKINRSKFNRRFFDDSIFTPASC